MPFKIGGTDVADVKLGSAQVEAIYKGTQEVWSSKAPPPVVVGTGVYIPPAVGGGVPFTADWSALGQQTGDIIVITCDQGTGSNTGIGMVDTAGATTLRSGTASSGSYTWNHSIYWGRADEIGTSKQFPTSANAANSGQWNGVIVTVLRGVDNANPIEAALTENYVQNTNVVVVPTYVGWGVTVSDNALVLMSIGTGAAQNGTTGVSTTDTLLGLFTPYTWDPDLNFKTGKVGGHILVPNPAGGLITPAVASMIPATNNRYGNGAWVVGFRAG